MDLLLEEIRHDPLLRLLVFVSVMFTVQTLKPEVHALLFVLSVLAIVPLAALLSHVTESVATGMGDAAGGMTQHSTGLSHIKTALPRTPAG